MGLPKGENFIILTSTIFLWYIRLTNRWTDRQRDGQTGDNVHICCRTLKTTKIIKKTRSSWRTNSSFPNKNYKIMTSSFKDVWLLAAANSCLHLQQAC